LRFEHETLRDRHGSRRVDDDAESVVLELAIAIADDEAPPLLAGRSLRQPRGGTRQIDDDPVGIGQCEDTKIRCRISVEFDHETGLPGLVAEADAGNAYARLPPRQ